MASKHLLNNFKVVNGKALCETAMSGITSYPASGSFIDVRGYETVHIVAHFGTLHGSDTPVLEPKCANAANGSLTRIDASLAHTANVTTDDGLFVVWSIGVNTLPEGKFYIALAVSGTVTHGSFVDPVFLLEGNQMLPPTQNAAQIPADNRYAWT